MYYILFVILILFIFIKNKKSKRWINSQEDNYFSFFNKNDLQFRNCKSINDCKKKYIDSGLRFTLIEEYTINSIIKNFNFLIDNKMKQIFNNISIVKVKNNIENGMPHTRSRNIILSENIVDEIIFNFIKNPKNLKFPKLLAHEQFHIYQRYNQNKISKFYKNYWNMEKLKYRLPNELLNINRTNPDALPNYNWLFKTKDYLILPLCLYRKDASSLRDTENIYIRLDKNHNFIDLMDDLENRKLLINNKDFRYFFGEESANNYHPNEISASLFELIIEDVITKKNKKRSKGYNLLKKYLLEY
tara:strand:+ start:9901 stop:10806 length:906 start_codon:yes stop_codon:yes gene_type:complete